MCHNAKDKRILAALDLNPNSPLSGIAKKAIVSKQVAEYRLRKLLEQKTIYAFFSLIDPGKLGYTLFRAHIKLKNIPEAKYAEFARNLFEGYPTFWVAFVSGSFDIITDIWAQSSNAFDTLFAHILEQHKEVISSYELYPLLELNMYNYGYFLTEKTQRRRTILFHHEKGIQIDETNQKILHTLKSNSRLPYEEIGRKVHLSRNAVKRRIQQLEKIGIIAGYQMMIHFLHFNRLSYKIFIQYNLSEINQEHKLIDFIKQIPGILAHTKLLGRWNLDIEIQPHDAKDLQHFIIELRNRFSIIKDYEIAQILEDYGIDFYPERLEQLK